MNLLRSEKRPGSSDAGRRSLSRMVMLAVLVLLAAGAVALRYWPRGAETLAPSLPSMLPVRVQNVVRTNLADRLVLTGRVEADKDVRLAVDDNGRVLWIGADKGELVREGQLLLRLDDAAATAAVARAEVSLRQADEDLARWSAMKEAGGVSVQDFERVKHRRELDRIALEEARGLLAKRQVRSPVDGRINERWVEVGEMAMPGNAAFQVVKIDKVKVVMDVPERDVGFMREGTPLPFKVDALGDGLNTGEVAFVASAADAASLTFRMELAVDNAGDRFRPGMIARVQVERGVLRDVVVVPLQSLIPEQGQYVAYVVAEGRAVRRIVRLASIVDTLAVVRDGLDAGDRIIIAGQRMVTDGAVVKVMP